MPDIPTDGIGRHFEEDDLSIGVDMHDLAISRRDRVSIAVEEELRQPVRIPPDGVAVLIHEDRRSPWRAFPRIVTEGVRLQRKPF